MHLIKRNYSPNKLDGILSNISKLKREEILPYNNTNKMSLNKCIKFLFEFNYSYDDFIKNSLYNNLNKIKNELHIFTDKKFIIINIVQKNLNAILIHNYSL